MARVRQYYGEAGVPVALPNAPADVIDAWRTHRTRMRGWLAELPESRWSDPTRCSEWTIRDIAQHLVSGAQFLGYTLHQASKGEATSLLKGFDAQATPAATTAQWGGRSPADLLVAIDAMDDRIEHGIAALAEGEWRAWAEAPPGRVPAYVAVHHFLFDSWVHERDLLLPAGEQPVVVAREASCVASYVLALAGVTGRADDGDALSPVSLVVRLSDIDQTMRVDVDDAGARVALSAEAGAPDVVAPVGWLVDVATGRRVDDTAALPETAQAYLHRLATVMG